jgi:hypothetical protein
VRFNFQCGLVGLFVSSFDGGVGVVSSEVVLYGGDGCNGVGL